MANRLTRDQILLRGLGLVDSPRLDEKDQPTAGTIVSTALSIGWLQDALDLAMNLYPMSGALLSATFDITAGTGAYTISAITSTFVLDFKDGIILPDDKGRLTRASFNALLNVPTGTSARSQPTRYGIQNGTLILRPVPLVAYTAATLYYYSLPVVLSAGTVPNFPSDLLLVEYVHLRGREWLRELPAGTAEKYLIDATARLQKSGLGSEAEIDDVISLDRHVFPGGGSSYQSGGDWFTRVNA
mgnify:CR=1 FL=1